MDAVTILRMIRLGQTIQRGVRHPRRGLLFAIPLFLLLAMLSFGALETDQPGTSLGKLGLGFAMTLGMVLLVRVRSSDPVQPAVVRGCRPPPTTSRPHRPPCRISTFASPMRV